MLMRTYIGIPVALLFVYPLCLIKDMSGFNKISIFSLIAIFYTMVMLLVQLPEYYQVNYQENRVNFASLNVSFFECAAIILFAYTCHPTVIPIYRELNRPTVKRIDKAINVSMSMVISFYLIISLAGYFSTFDLTNPIVLQRKPIDGTEYNIPNIVAIAAIIIVLFICIPITYNPMRT